jgi:DNA-binding IclR family transcriptional regulator
MRASQRPDVHDWRADTAWTTFAPAASNIVRLAVTGMANRSQISPNPTPAASMSSADKVLAALGLFTFERPEWTIEEAANELQLGVSTTYRYFKSLSEAGLIVAFAAGRYVLGPAITQLDRQTRLLDPLISTAKPIMQDLIKQLGAHGVLLLCRLYRDQVMCVHHEALEGHAMAVSYERGKLMPLHRGASSKIVLAHLPPRFVRSFHQEHAADMAAVSLGISWGEVKRSLRKLRAAGIAVTVAELDPGVIGAAAPLFSPEGTIVGSLSMVISEGNPESALVGHVTNLMKTGAKLIDASTTAIAAGLIPTRFEARMR